MRLEKSRPEAAVTRQVNRSRLPPAHARNLVVHEASRVRRRAALNQAPACGITMPCLGRWANKCPGNDKLGRGERGRKACDVQPVQSAQHAGLGHGRGRWRRKLCSADWGGGASITGTGTGQKPQAGVGRAARRGGAACGQRA